MLKIENLGPPKKVDANKRPVEAKKDAPKTEAAGK